MTIKILRTIEAFWPRTDAWNYAHTFKHLRGCADAWNHADASSICAAAHMLKGFQASARPFIPLYTVPLKFLVPLDSTPLRIPCELDYLYIYSTSWDKVHCSDVSCRTLFFINITDGFWVLHPPVAYQYFTVIRTLRLSADNADAWSICVVSSICVADWSLCWLTSNPRDPNVFFNLIASRSVPSRVEWILPNSKNTNWYKLL